MVRTWNAGNAVRAATFRKWYARAWWIGLHVYGYVVLGYKGALSPDALSMPQFVLSLVVAVVTISYYIVLQCSSPGFLKKRPSVSPAIGQSTMPMTVNSPSPIPAAEDGVKTELLAEGSEHDLSGNSNDLHFCNDCHVFQPLRTKHWYNWMTVARMQQKGARCWEWHLTEACFVYVQ